MERWTPWKKSSSIGRSDEASKQKYQHPNKNVNIGVGRRVKGRGIFIWNEITRMEVVCACVCVVALRKYIVDAA